MDSEFTRFKQAYLAMVETAKYRPFAPSDGLGGIYLDEEELADPERLAKEAAEYAKEFQNTIVKRDWSLGVPNYTTNRALVYAVEAAKCMNAGMDHPAKQLLQLALREVEESIADRKRDNSQ